MAFGGRLLRVARSAAVVRSRPVVAPMLASQWTMPLQLTAAPHACLASTAAGSSTPTEGPTITIEETKPAYTVDEIVHPDAQGVKRTWHKQKFIKGSYKKLIHLLRQITGMSAGDAMAQMVVSPKWRSNVLRYAIKRAVFKMRFRHHVPVEHCIVEQAVCGVHMRRRKIKPTSRGRMMMLQRDFCWVKVHLREMTDAEKEVMNRFDKNEPVLKHLKDDPRFY